MSPLSNFWLCSLSITASLLISAPSLIQAVELSIPSRSRTEGQITLTIPSGSSLVEHHLPFSETIDLVLGRSVLAIGYIGMNPNRYYAREWHQPLFVDSDGMCQAANHPAMLVPELAWLSEHMFPDCNLARIAGVQTSQAGPTMLINVVTKMMSSQNFYLDREEVHRNVEVKVYSKIGPINEGKLTLKLEVFIPDANVHFRNFENTFFSLKVSSFNGTVDKDKIDRNPPRATLLLDYYNIDSFDDQSDRFDMILEDFNLPMAKGCSEFLHKFQPYMTSQSFSMNYFQISKAEYQYMAYDHTTGFLRKERPDKAFSIWDLKEDILYYAVTSAQNAIPNSMQTSLDNLQMCGVLKVSDEQLGKAYRPFKYAGLSLDILQMIGAQSLAHIGHSTVRDMPCLVYESILDEPPVIFALPDETHIQKKMPNKIDYIVQFHILKPFSGSTKLDDEQAYLAIDKFWPAKIKLFRRIREKNLIHPLDELEIYDFYSSIDGGPVKASELFMAPQCFSNDDQQARVELAILFDKVHHNQDIPNHENWLKLLALNKFALENYLIADLTDMFHVSRMHLVNQQMRLQPNHVEVELQFSDRDDLKKLVYQGEGTLPSEDSYPNNRIIIMDMDEEECLMTSSLITDVSLVVYCPNSPGQKSTCFTVYSEPEPSVKMGESFDPLKAACQVYRFTPTEPIKVVANLSLFQLTLEKHRINDFEATIPESVQDKALVPNDRNAKIVKLNGFIKDFEVQQHTKFEKVDNYMFAEEQPEGTESEVKSYKTFKYTNEGDCAKMCNMDPSCRSYSYCSNIKLLEEGKNCLWSTLDIRGAKVREQLKDSIPNERNGYTISVSGNNRDKIFNLKFTDHCDIFERNYLSLFRETTESYRISKLFVDQLQSTNSAFQCAKESLDLELANPGYHVAMFAFCPGHNLCLLDEQLFNKTNQSVGQLVDQGDSDDPTKVAADVDKETPCKVYRKKYHTYFQVSPKVLKQSAQQVEFPFKNVEECARACWTKFGQSCASFDFCSEGSCKINSIGIKNGPKVELETRPLCLHYERDLAWDKFSEDHSIGRHQIFVPGAGGTGSGTEGRGPFATFFLWIFSLGALVVGLMMGIRVNDNMEAVKIIRQSFSGESGRRRSMFSSGLSAAHNIFGFQATQDPGYSNYIAAEDVYQNDEDVFASPNENSNAIRMDIINSNGKQPEE